MRLLNINTLRLESFEADIPDYAILSHTWTKDEIAFEDLADISSDQVLKIQRLLWATRLGSGMNKLEHLWPEPKVGFQKIVSAMAITFAKGLQYLWVDTGCISKSSSAELSEAINSMFKWYQSSKVCIAFLDDVDGMEDFKHAKWWTRGWTLQELIAPESVLFYNKSWSYLGDKHQFSKEISHITRIKPTVLETKHQYRYASISERMSWQSRRQTSRPEDLAYSLLGLFDVHMPLLYGEGENAFQRLQEEIMKKSTDHSLFLWHSNRPGTPFGILAPHPSNFSSGAYERGAMYGEPALPFTMTNKGLSIRLPVIACPNGDLIACTDCCKGNPLSWERMGIALRPLGHEANSSTYCRIADPMVLSEQLRKRATLQDIMILKTTGLRMRFDRRANVRMSPRVWSSFSFSLVDDGPVTIELARKSTFWDRPWNLVNAVVKANPVEDRGFRIKASSQTSNDAALIAKSIANPNLSARIQFGLVYDHVPASPTIFQDRSSSPLLWCEAIQGSGGKTGAHTPDFKERLPPLFVRKHGYLHDLPGRPVASRVKIPGHGTLVTTVRWDLQALDEVLTVDVEFDGILRTLNRAARELYGLVSDLARLNGADRRGVRRDRRVQRLLGMVAWIASAYLLGKVASGPEHLPFSGRWSALLVFALSATQDRRQVDSAARIGILLVCLLRLEDMDVNTVMHGILTAYMGLVAYSNTEDIDDDRITA